MSWFSDFYRSAVGKKTVMAVSGIILFGFVLVHMIGNLHLYEGAHAVLNPDGTPVLQADGTPEMAWHINEYGAFLRSVGEPALPHEGALWIARLVLLAAVLLHIWSAWAVTRLDWAARPHDYAQRRMVKATYASRTMRWGGVIILLFVIYHLLDLTAGTLNPSFVEGDVHHNMVAGFGVWYVSLFYIVAQAALGLHLYHGLWSMFQSLGWNHPRYNHWRNGFAHVFAWIITLGNISFPVAVLTGPVR
jgi:succinate dehydrogenase cytochrome b subunit